MANTLESKAALKPTAPNWVYYATLLLIAIAPTQFAYAVDAKHGPFVAYSDLLLAAVLALWVLWRLTRRTVEGLVWPPGAVIGLLIVAMLSAGRAESLKTAAIEIFQLGLYFVAAYMLFVDLLDRRERIRTALIVLAVPTLVNILIGVWQYATADDPFAVGGVLTNRNVYSAYLAMVLPVAFGVMVWAEQAWLRWLLGCGVAVGAVTMLAPPLMWVLVAVLAVMTGFSPARARAAASVLVILIALAVMLVPRNRDAAIVELLDPAEQGPIYKTLDHDYVVKKRWLEWQPALSMLADNFALGVGVGNYQLNIGRSEFYGFLPNVKKSEPDTNNLYLVIAGSMGFAGLVCLVAYVGGWLRRAGTLWLLVEDGWAKGVAVGLLGAVASLALTNVFSSLFVRGTGLVWALMFALVISISRGAMNEVPPVDDTE
ncbi:MAG TPA: hypothetical protein DGT21_21255 [Armatimonadetes bacterium]|jgi:hypothetical protein|nr:hypothetical protein [Armatimonadota bacterium]